MVDNHKKIIFKEKLEIQVMRLLEVIQLVNHQVVKDQEVVLISSIKTRLIILKEKPNKTFSLLQAKKFQVALQI